jgi:hypothetical protein
MFAQTKVRVNMIAPGTFPTEVCHTIPGILNEGKPSQQVCLYRL